MPPKREIAPALTPEGYMAGLNAQDPAQRLATLQALLGAAVLPQVRRPARLRAQAPPALRILMYAPPSLHCRAPLWRPASRIAWQA